MNIIESADNLYYVGGCVRDEILGIAPVDIDICYEGDAVGFVRQSGFKILKIQDDIRTARVLVEAKEIDIASTRTESYPKQGHLPVVDKVGCTLAEDLKRRDFTINSIAKSIKTGEFIDLTGGIEDLKAKLLRVHHKNSFMDDPTRIIRGLKFSLRFGLSLSPETKKLQEEYLANVNYDMSYSRLKKELVDTFNLNLQEAFIRFVNEKMYKLLSPKEVKIPNENIQQVLNEFPVENPWIVYLGCFDLSRFELTKEEKKILKDFETLRSLSDNIDSFEVYKICKKSDIKSVLLWVINSENAHKNYGLRYLRELRHISLEISGDDLIKLGFSGREVGELLDKVLKIKLANPEMTKEDELELIKKDDF